MNLKAMNWVWALQNVAPESRLVLLALAFEAKGSRVYPSETMLLNRTGLPVEDLRERLTALKGSEHLRVVIDGAEREVYLAMPTKALRKTREVVAPASAPDMQEAVDIWNEMAKRSGLATVRVLTDDMKAKLSVRLAVGGLTLWAAAVAAVEQNGHCRGINDRKWKADFHYLLQAKGFSKAINGGWPSDYEEVSNGGQRTSPSGRGDQRLDRLRGFDAAVRGDLPDGDGRGGSGPQDRA